LSTRESADSGGSATGAAFLTDVPFFARLADEIQRKIGVDRVTQLCSAKTDFGAVQLAEVA
jgi:hypothetical protein